MFLNIPEFSSKFDHFNVFNRFNDYNHIRMTRHESKCTYVNSCNFKVSLVDMICNVNIINFLYQNLIIFDGFDDFWAVLERFGSFSSTKIHHNDKIFD